MKRTGEFIAMLAMYVGILTGKDPSMRELASIIGGLALIYVLIMRGISWRREDAMKAQLVRAATAEAALSQELRLLTRSNAELSARLENAPAEKAELLEQLEAAASDEADLRAQLRHAHDGGMWQNYRRECREDVRLARHVCTGVMDPKHDPPLTPRTDSATTTRGA